MTPADARARFPVLERCAYLNAGTTGPLSRATAAAMTEWEERGLLQGRSGRRRWEAGAELRRRLLERLSTLIGASPERVLLTTSTTEGCNIVMTGLRFGPEDEIVTTDAEHPGLLEPVLACGARVRVAAVAERPAAEALAAILAEVTPLTRLIALSHVLWINGHVLPVAEIKRRTGLPLLVDGAQSVGAVPVNVASADYYTVSGQKSLCGPELTGALYVADPDTLRPRMCSYATRAMQGAERLSVSHHAPSALAGLLAALEERPPWAFERAQALTAYCRAALLRAGIEVRTEPGQGTLVSFSVTGDPDAAVERCQERGVVIRSLPNGWLRASCGWWTAEEDVDRLVDALTG